MKWNDKKNHTLTFDMQPSEEAKEFFLRTMKEHKDQEEAFKKRIRQLFKEHISFEEENDDFYNKILQVFGIGYQCGWNDHYSLFKE